MRRTWTLLALTAAFLASLAAFTIGTAGATTGNVSVDQHCGGGYVSVSVALTTEADTTEILSTIPGVPGVTLHVDHPGPDLVEIWAQEWQGNDKAGTVTLNLYHPDGVLIFTDSATVAPVPDCPPPPPPSTIPPCEIEERVCDPRPSTTTTTTVPELTTTTTPTPPATTVEQAPPGSLPDTGRAVPGLWGIGGLILGLGLLAVGIGRALIRRHPLNNQ